MHFTQFNLSVINFSFSASKQILLTHAATKKDQELYIKKKSTQGSQKSYKGRPAGAIVDTGQPILEEETVSMPTIEENASTPQRVYLCLREPFNEWYYS